MTGRMIEFDSGGTSAPGYFAAPASGTGPGVVVLHEWWGLTDPIRQACDRLAEAGFLALAPDMYRGKTTDSIEEADALGSALDQNEARWRGDIIGALPSLREHGASGPFGFIALSLGGSYALGASIELADKIAAVVTYYATYPGLDYGRAKAAYLCHFAEDDQYVSAEDAADLERSLRAAGRPVTAYTYPGTKHWFFDSNRPNEYDPAAAALAWERTVAFLNTEMRG